MSPLFTTYKSLVDTFLTKFLEEKKSSLAAVNDFGTDLTTRVNDMITRGKTIRGSLVLLAYCFTNAEPSKDAVKIGAAMELIQTALLIHDDIMDHDDLRRGLPTMHVQFKSTSLAMCVGDVLFFMAFELLGSVKTDEVTFGRIMRLVGREYQYVGVAQMADDAKSAKTELDILNLYTYKTARYTFALPLMLGATLAGTTKETLKYLESFGVAAGVLFQIQDDILSITGDEKRTGKRVGNDAKEEKMTLAALFHNDTEKLRAYCAKYKTAAEESLARLPVGEDKKQILTDLLTFVATRQN